MLNVQNAVGRENQKKSNMESGYRQGKQVLMDTNQRNAIAQTAEKQ